MQFQDNLLSPLVQRAVDENINFNEVSDSTSIGDSAINLIMQRSLNNAARPFRNSKLLLKLQLIEPTK